MMKLCFVTVGATAPFPKLLERVYTIEFLDALKACGFTHLIVQFGEGGKKYCKDFIDRLKLDKDKLDELHPFVVGGFSFTTSMEWWFRMVIKAPYAELEYDIALDFNDMYPKDLDFKRDTGMIICHAGKITPSPSTTSECLVLTVTTGTGTILDAIATSVPLIIVPNEDLADNHQEELADMLAEMDYAHKASPE